MARKFCELSSSNRIEITNANFLDADDGNRYDLIIMVDIVFQMVVNLYNGALDATMKWLSSHLADGGMVFLEIEDMSDKIDVIRQKGEDRIWYEFSDSDPFQYGLFRTSLQNDTDLLYEKIFIRRDGGAASRTVSVWKSFTRQDMLALFSSYGFISEICDYYSSEEEKAAAHGDGSYTGRLFRVLTQKNEHKPEKARDN